MIFSQFDPFILETKQLWIDTLNNPKSVFYKDSQCEKILKLRYPKLKAKKALVLLKLIKLEAMKLLKNPKRFGVYVGQNSWANSLGVNQQRVSQLVKYLEDLGLIQSEKLMIESKSGKMGSKLLVFPNALEPEKTFENIRTFTIESNTLTIHTCKNTNKFQYLDGKSLNRLLYRYYNYYNNVFYSVNTSYLPHRIIAFEKTESDDGSFTTSLDKKNTCSEFTKKSIAEIKSSTTPLESIEKTKVENLEGRGINFDLSNKESIEKPSTKGDIGPMKRKTFKYKLKERIIDYSNYELFQTDFFDHIKIQEIQGKFLDKLVEKNIVPKTEETKEIIEYWNNISDKRFSKIRRLQGKNFNLLRLLVSYRIYFDMLSVDEIKKSVNLFIILSTKSRHLKFTKMKFKLVDFLTGIKNQYTGKSWFTICQLDEIEAINQSHCGYKIEFDKTINERIKPSLAKYFYSDFEEMAAATINTNLYLVNKLTDELVRFHRICYTYGMDMSHFVDMFFKYLSEQTENWSKGKPNISQILKIKHITAFFFSQRQEPGWEKFGNDKKKEKNKEDIEETP